MISVPQLCRTRLEDGRLSNTILLPVGVQLYDFHRNFGKKKSVNQHKQESNKKRCVGKFTERSLSRTQH